MLIKNGPLTPMKVKEDGTKVKKAPEEWRKMQKPKTMDLSL